MPNILNTNITQKFYLSRFSFDELVFSSLLLLQKNTFKKIFINGDGDGDGGIHIMCFE